MNNKAIFSIVAVTLLLMTAVPIVSSDSEGAEIGDFEVGHVASDYEVDKKSLAKLH